MRESSYHLSTFLVFSHLKSKYSFIFATAVKTVECPPLFTRPALPMTAQRSSCPGAGLCNSLTFLKPRSLDGIPGGAVVWWFPFPFGDRFLRYLWRWRHHCSLNIRNYYSLNKNFPSPGLLKSTFLQQMPSNVLPYPHCFPIWSSKGASRGHSIFISAAGS